MGEWQPIETAPKDGPFIVYGGTWEGEVFGPHPNALPAVVVPCGARFDVLGTDAYSAWIYEPTHWMALPEPPDA